MEEQPTDLNANRALTDTSLAAERAGADEVNDRALALARLRLDNLIERDRFLADDRLLKFRKTADRLIELDRLASTPPNHNLDEERDTADESIRAEREAADTLLELERGRVDARSAGRGRGMAEDSAEQASQRQETDARLSEERNYADSALGSITTALGDLQADSGRRGDVLAMVTHDLRSPLTVIVANASLLIQDTTDGATREAAEEMLGAGTRMGRLLEDLLDVVRIGSGTLRVVKGVHDVDGLLSEVLHSYRPLFASRGIRFVVELPAAPMPLPFDYDRVVQLLSNLLANAMKFTPSGGVVDLKAEQHDGKVELIVRNTGNGIAPEALPHVFERFWKIDAEGAKRGLGLGLFICKSIAEAHGGAISVESELGQGATFRVTLPMTESPAEAT